MTKDLTVGKPDKVLWKFCLPLFGSIIFQQLYNIADSFVAGKFVGEDALAAVGNSYEITLIFIAFAFGCNIGCSVIVSQLFGAKRLKDMKTAVYMAATFTDLILRVVFAKILSVFFGTTGIWLAWPLGWTVAMGMSVMFYHSGAWNKKCRDPILVTLKCFIRLFSVFIDLAVTDTLKAANSLKA